MRLPFLTIILILLFSINSLFADQEASNRLYIKSSEYGECYAKCFPDEEYGGKGKTYIYLVRKDTDLLEHVFDWYSKQIFLKSGSPFSIVRLGPWARGRNPIDSDLAIAFYSLEKNSFDKKLKEYSTLDIAKIAYDDSSAISVSVSHYTVFKEIQGYHWIRGNKFSFDVKTYENKILSFDISTGQLIDKEEQQSDIILNKINDLKIEWFSKNKNMLKDKTFEYILSEEELKKWAGDRYPKIPKGYRVSIGKYIGEVILNKITP